MSSPHGGVRSFHQMSTCLYIIELRASFGLTFVTPQNVGVPKPLYSTEWQRVLVQGVCYVRFVENTKRFVENRCFVENLSCILLKIRNTRRESVRRFLLNPKVIADVSPAFLDNQGREGGRFQNDIHPLLMNEVQGLLDQKVDHFENPGVLALNLSGPPTRYRRGCLMIIKRRSAWVPYN